MDRTHVRAWPVAPAAGDPLQMGNAEIRLRRGQAVALRVPRMLRSTHLARCAADLGSIVLVAPWIPGLRSTAARCIAPGTRLLPRFCDLRCRHGGCGIAPGITDIGRDIGDLLVG